MHDINGGLPKSLLHLELAAEQASVALLADRIAALAEEQGWEASLGFQVDLVLEELVQNIVSYGYPEGNPGQLLVSITEQAGALLIRIEDDGIPFDPFALPEPDTEAAIEERRIGGLGVHFSRELTDHHSYRRHNNHNCVELVKRRDPER